MREPSRRTRRGGRSRTRLNGSSSATTVAAWIALLGVIAIAIGMGISLGQEQSETSTIKNGLSNVPTNQCTCDPITRIVATPTPTDPMEGRAPWLVRTANDSKLMLFRASVSATPRLYDAYEVDISASPPTFGPNRITTELLPDPPVTAPNSDYVFTFTSSSVPGEYFACLVSGAVELISIGIPENTGAVTAEYIADTPDCGPAGAFGGDNELYFVDGNSEVAFINQTSGAQISIVFAKDRVFLTDSLSNTHMSILSMAYNPVTGNWWVLYIMPFAQASYGNPGKVARTIGKIDLETGYITNGCFQTFVIFSSIAFDTHGRMWLVDGNANDGDTRYLYMVPKEPCLVLQ